MLHHAVVAYGSPETVQEFASFISKETKIDPANNANFHVRSYESLGVEEARALTDLAGLSGEGSRVFVVAAARITREAQNALLKVFEEPGKDMTFALLVPHGTLISTLRSRMQEIAFQSEKKETTGARDFLAASASERSKLIEAMVEDKDKAAAYQLIVAIERRLAQSVEKKEVRTALEEIAIMRSYLMDTSASVKMILEHLALVIPKS